MVTPVESPTSAEHGPVVTAAACTGEAIKVTGIATTENAKKPMAPNTDNTAREDENRLNMFKSYS
jgi:hypothetical protein